MEEEEEGREVRRKRRRRGPRSEEMVSMTALLQERKPKKQADFPLEIRSLHLKTPRVVLVYFLEYSGIKSSAARFENEC